MYCRFVTNEETLFGHVVRGLEINCDSGYVGSIYVTKEPAFSIQGKVNTWHYEINNGRITLTGVGNNSVNFNNDCHVEIKDCELKD